VSGTWWRARPALSAAVIYLVMSVVFIGPALLPGNTLSSSDMLYSQVPWTDVRPADAPGLGTNFELADASNVFQPFLRYTRERLPEAPLWNSHIMGGRPYVGNAQSQVFSPFSAPSYVLPFWMSLAWVGVLKLWIAAFGTYLFARSLGMRFGGALFAGVVFTFGTFFVVWLAWPLASIFCLIPYLFWVSDIVVRRPGPLPVAALAVLTSLTFFGGHPETTFHVMAVVIAWFAFRALQLHGRAWRELVRPSLWFAGGVALGVGLCAIAALPFVELLLNSGDLHRRLGNQEASYWPRKYLGALFLHDYWGRPTQTDVDPFMSNRGWYAGGLTLMLASAALVVKRDVTRIAFVVLGVVSACIVVGIPPIFQIVTNLPGFKTSHNERMLIFTLLGLAMLGGWGLDDLSDRELPARAKRRAVLIVAGVLAVVPIAWMLLAGTLTTTDFGEALKVAWLFEHPPTLVFPPTDANGIATSIVRMSSLLIWLPLAALAVALLWWRLKDRRVLAASAFVALAVLLVSADLFRANMGFNPSIKVDNAKQPTTDAIRYLQSRRPNRFAGLGTELFAQPMPTDTAMTYGLYDARGYDYPVEKRFDKLWRRAVAPHATDFTQPVQFAERDPAAIRGLGLLSTTDLIVGPGEPPLKVPGLRVAYRGPDAVVYANDAALPRAFLVGGQQTVDGDDAALAAVTAPGFDGRRAAVTESPVAGLSAGPAPSPGSARIVSYADERAVLESRAARPSLLVLTDVWYPGWKATLDGKPADIERVNYLMRGVKVPPGTHRVEMRYEPASWRAGWIISLVCLLIVIGLVVAGIRQRGRAG
jgi:hypothetical protein